MPEPILCYVEGGFAFFTTQPLDEAWGDDWDDAPYEHNAGDPSPWYERTVPVYTDADGIAVMWREGLDITGLTFEKRVPLLPEHQPAKYEIIKVAFEGPFEQPCDGHTNSPFSVQQINAGAIAWLRTHSYVKKPMAIPAGTALDQFCYRVTEAGGKVYLDPESSWTKGLF